MMQSVLNRQGQLPDGHKKNYKSFYDNGNLIYLRQRMDIGNIEQDSGLAAKVFIKVGKCKIEGSEFIEKVTKDGKLEIPQQYYTSFPDRVKEIRQEMLIAEIRQRKAQGNYNYESFMYQEMKDMVDLIKRER